MAAADAFVQLSLDEELARVLEQGPPQNRPTSSQGTPAGDGAQRLLKRLVRRGLSEAALPAAAGLVLQLEELARARREVATAA